MFLRKMIWIPSVTAKAAYVALLLQESLQQQLPLQNQHKW
jgi:hypothetical protein